MGMRYNFQVCLKVAVFHRLCQVQQATSKQAAKAAPADLFPNPWCPPPSLSATFISNSVSPPAVSSTISSLPWAVGILTGLYQLIIKLENGNTRQPTVTRQTQNLKHILKP